MNGFVKFLIWIIVLGAIGYFGYQAYTKWWDADLVGSKTKTIQGTVASTTEKARTLAEEKAGAIKEKAKEYTSQVVGEAKEGAMDFVKRKIGEGISAIGDSIAGLGNSVSGVGTSTQAIPVSIQNIVQNYYSSTGGAQASNNQIPIPTSTSYFKPPSSTSIITETNTPLVFSINSNVSYQVDWGDGNKEAGKKTTGNVKLLSHSWTTKGDYNVNFSIMNGSTSTYSFPVRVY